MDQGTNPTGSHVARQIIVPVCNEGYNVVTFYRELSSRDAPFDSLTFIYDDDSDTSLPFLRKLTEEDARVCGEKNGIGLGVLNALCWGFEHCEPGPVVVMMGDFSDDISILPHVMEEWRRGATIVCPSRYMKGGAQEGGGAVKSTLSRMAGRSLRWLGFPTTDPTNSFKLYDGQWLSEQMIESTGGFEVALELCYKACRDGKRIVELPTIWHDRETGKSRFRLVKWLPHYLKWYVKAVALLLFKQQQRTP